MIKKLTLKAKSFVEVLYFLQNKLYVCFARKDSIFITASKYLYPPSDTFPTRGKKKKRVSAATCGEKYAPHYCPKGLNLFVVIGLKSCLSDRRN
jgi:hypothetical protein